MAKYTKHNSNYIKTEKHQSLKDGSNIFERDWVTIGSQLNFGPGKIPYYNDGNFIFTTSPTPHYQKRYKNGVTVATWTYEDVKDASPIVNQIRLDEYSEDIRNYAYYGSCTELLRTTIENIINTFPGNITVSDEEIGFIKTITTFNEGNCESESTEHYVPVTGSSTGLYLLNNPFDINLHVKDVRPTRYDNPLHYLTYSFKDYKISTDGGTNWVDIDSYEVITRSMYEKEDDPCEQTMKVKWKNGVSFEKVFKATWRRTGGGEILHEEYYEYGTNTNWNVSGALWDVMINGRAEPVNMPYTVRSDVEFVLRHGSVIGDVNAEILTSKTFEKRVYLKKAKYFIEYNDVRQGWEKVCYQPGENPTFELQGNAEFIRYEFNGSGGRVYAVTNQGNETIYNVSNEKFDIDFYSVETFYHTYKSYQMFSDEELPQNQGWTRSTCIMNYWLPKTSNNEQEDAESDFLNMCDNKGHEIIRYSYLSDYDTNLPVYTITINGTKRIEGYIFNGEVIPFSLNNNMIIQPKEEVIEEYFANLEGFEKQLLTRKTKPLYTNRFITPLEYNLGYLYYKRTYTWPSNGYCIDITSPRYSDYITKLSNTAELLDELWTDNLWRRMTHEAIKNYDWTYTREYVDGDEEDNVDGGERMHKVLNVIGRVFDDVKRTIDTIKKNNKISYDADRNIPNALLSDKLEMRGWDIYSTITTHEEISEQETITVSDAEQNITEEFLNDDYITNEQYREKWYPTLDPSKMTFADVDVEFMRRLLLSTRRIFETKGTLESIDMVMGMFGYGNDDYGIREEYYVLKPRKYDEIITGEETLGDRIVRLNNSKQNDYLYYNDDVSGIPVGSFVTFERKENTQTHEMENVPTTYLIPYYDQRKVYDGDFYFQSKGGWFYNRLEEEDISEKTDETRWTETVSYLHVVSQVKDLLNVVPNSANNGDIYYVANINDYIQFTETDIEYDGHFFVLKNDYNPDLFESWMRIHTEIDEQGKNYYEKNTDVYSQDEIEEYTNYVNKANYLDSIIPYNIGNNPHVGYGKYDMGKEYFDYMTQPFKYSVETNNFFTMEEISDARDITFDISIIELENNKVQIFADNTDEGKDVSYLDIVKEKKEDSPDDSKWGVFRYAEYDVDKIKELTENTYFLNSKVIYFTNNVIEENDGTNYKNYFKNVIIKYLMQVIPSTAILVLEGFE